MLISYYSINLLISPIHLLSVGYSLNSSLELRFFPKAYDLSMISKLLKSVDSCKILTYQTILVKSYLDFRQKTYYIASRENLLFAYAKTKAQISCAVTVQRLCFRYIDSSILLLSKSKISCLDLAMFGGCTARFVSDMVGIPEYYRFSHEAVHIASRGLGLD